MGDVHRDRPQRWGRGRVHYRNTCAHCRQSDANVEILFEVLMTAGLTDDERLRWWRIGGLFA